MTILTESQLAEIEHEAHALFGPTAEGPWAHRPLPLEVVDGLLASHRELQAEVERLRMANERIRTERPKEYRSSVKICQSCGKSTGSTKCPRCGGSTR